VTQQTGGILVDSVRAGSFPDQRAPTIGFRCAKSWL